MRKLTILLIILLVLPAALYSQGEREHGKDQALTIPEHIPDLAALELGDAKLSIVATTSIIGDIIRQVAGDLVDLTILMEQDMNPHSYQASPSDFRKIEEADLVVINGLDLEEGLLDDLAATARGWIIPISDGIELLHDDEDEEDFHAEEGESEGYGDEHAHEAGNPHVWLNPLNIVIWVENLIDVLSAVDPDNADLYENQGEWYMEQLYYLDEEIEQQLSQMSNANRSLITDHHLLTYFAERYDFELLGAIIEGSSDSSEPSARDIARLSDIMEEHDLSAIFVGTTSSANVKKLAETLRAETGRDIELVTLLTGSLTSPYSNEPAAGTYIEYMQYNVSQILSTAD